MFLSSWLRSFRPTSTPCADRGVNHAPRSPRLNVEPLEDRALLSATLSITDVSVTEGQGNQVVLFRVTLSEPATETVTVKYATADGSARAKDDYQSASGTLTFALGETTQTIAVTIKGDQKVEGDEYFYTVLSEAVGAVIVDTVGYAMIYDDDYGNGGGHHCTHPHYC